MNSVTKMGIDAFSKLAHKLNATLKECSNDLPLDYVFDNQDIDCTLEYFSSCDKYSKVYGWSWEKGLIEKELPEADAYSKDENEWTKRVRMVDVIKEFLVKQEISHIAVLLDVHYNSSPTVSKLLVYRFDKLRYEAFIREFVKK
jgi:hypothetical protein